MAQRRIPAAWMRGGTSKGVFFLASDLPATPAERDALLRRLIGSPDPYGKQIDGLGGATSSTSKVVIVGPSARPDCDVDYWFGQVPVGDGPVDWSGNCGNLTAAVGPFAIWRGLVAAGEGHTRIRIWQANLGKRIDAQVPTTQGEPLESGRFKLDGVAFDSAAIALDFHDPAGSGGSMFPTGNATDTLTLEDGRRYTASLVTAGNPLVFVAANDLAVDASASPASLNADTALLERCEQFRIAGALAMGLASTPEDAARCGHTPKLALVAPPAACVSADGRHFAVGDLDLRTRVLSMGIFHHAIPGTAVIALAAAASVPESLVAKQLRAPPDGALRIGHASGRTEASATLARQNGLWCLASVQMTRSARLLMDGWACLPA